MDRINLRYWDVDEVKRLIPDKFIERQVGAQLLDIFESGKIISIFGPRQSGKTSLMGWMINKLLKKGCSPQNINYANMDYFDLHPLVSDTRRFLTLLKEESNKKEKIYLFIDEIQRVENAGLLLKQMYDSERIIQVITSGSSAIGIKDRIKEYLTGRKIDVVLYPFSFLEFLRANDIIPAERIRTYEVEELKGLIELFGDRLLSQWREFVKIGGYPEIVSFPKRRKWLYPGLFSNYLEKDIGRLLSTADYRKLQDYIQLIASEIGKIYNRQSVSRILGRDARTIEKFEDLLLATFVTYKLTPFCTNIRKELSKSPRYYFIDTGLRNYIYGESENQLIKGTLFENSVINEFLKNSQRQDFSLHWWRSKGGAEVDLVIKRKKDIIPIEIKGIKEQKPKLTRSFISFIERYNPERAYFVTSDYYGITYHKNTKIYFLPGYAMGLLRVY